MGSLRGKIRHGSRLAKKTISAAKRTYKKTHAARQRVHRAVNSAVSTTKSLHQLAASSY